VIFNVAPDKDVASQAPFEIVFSSSRIHSIEGVGVPVAGHLKRTFSPSLTTTDLGLSDESADFDRKLD
jgi:hypothetical protein